MIVRTLAPDDVVAARALVERQFGGTRYCARLLEQVGDAEYRGLVALDDGSTVLAAQLFGEVSGASGVVKLHALIGDDVRALRAANAEFGMRTAATRLVVCELPDDAVFTTAARVLGESGFAEESRADDMVAGDVALLILVRRVTADS